MAWMNCQGARFTSLCALLGLLLLGCVPAKHPFLLVQTCLLDEGGVEAFTDEMRSIAAAEQMSFLDKSEGTARQLRDVGHEGQERTHGSRVINIGVHRSDGMGVSAGNLGLPGYEVALGFSEGSDATDARAFADRVVAQLEKHWRLQVVPQGVGAMPKGNCP